MSRAAQPPDPAHVTPAQADDLALPGFQATPGAGVVQVL
jgi:hypothetical protein